jgi:catechol 2,3-dioxygenase-like lactoylglutathione lyase family enzyme
MLQLTKVVPTIPVHDIERAVRFYEDKLGLKRTSVDSPDGVTLQGAGGCDLFIYTTKADLGGATRIGFEVKDLDSTMKELRDSGVVFEDYDMPNLKTDHGVAEYEGMRSAWFKDTEGNIINIAEMARDRSFANA